MRVHSSPCDIAYRVRRGALRLYAPLLRSIKDAILPRRYRLSVALVCPREIRRLNRAYRRKDEPTDILSFQLGPCSGEIILCPEHARKIAPSFGKTPRQFLLFLFIHGLLHLKGMKHGSKMEAHERNLCKQFSA